MCVQKKPQIKKQNLISHDEIRFLLTNELKSISFKFSKRFI